MNCPKLFLALMLACGLSLSAQTMQHKTLHASIVDQEHAQVRQEAQKALTALQKYSHDLYYQVERHRMRDLCSFNFNMTTPTAKINAEKHTASLTFDGTKVVEKRDNYFGYRYKSNPPLMPMSLKIKASDLTPYIWTITFYRSELTEDQEGHEKTYRYEIARMLYNAKYKQVIHVK